MTPHDGCRVSPFGHPRIKACSAAPRGFSQLTTSFIGSRRLGIHRWLFVAWKNKDARARYAILKGLDERRVIFVHALRNSLIPLATGLGHVFSLILAGSFLIERVFNIDGMGYLGYTSILQRDYPVALGILVIGSLLLLIGNILSDMIYALVDPRIRFK